MVTDASEPLTFNLSVHLQFCCLQNSSISVRLDGLLYFPQITMRSLLSNLFLKTSKNELESVSSIHKGISEMKELEDSYLLIADSGLTVIASSMSAITLTPYYSVVNASNGLWSDQISAIPVQSKPTIFSKTLPERGEQTE